MNIKKGIQKKYEIKLTKKLIKDIEKLKELIRKSILKEIDNLSNNPRPRGLKKLSNNSYRIRKGNYRILYIVDDTAKEIYILKIGNRKEVYRGLK